MKQTFLPALIIALLAAPIAHANVVTLTGEAAQTFVQKYFPNASVPGPVKGTFEYTKDGQTKKGLANCFFPAMGEASDGVVAKCDVVY
jgi:hypothetical protein